VLARGREKRGLHLLVTEKRDDWAVKGGEEADRFLSVSQRGKRRERGLKEKQKRERERILRLIPY